MRPSIVLGPGERFRPLGALLGGLGFDLRRIHDWADLGSVASQGRAVILVDAATTPQEDLGFVRRVLEKNGDARAVALGEDAGVRVARSLLAMPRVRWIHWPPDLHEILSITAGLHADEEGASDPTEDREERPSREPARGAQPATARASGRDAGADEIERIQSILEGGGEGFDEPDATGSALGSKAAGGAAESRATAPNSPSLDDETTFREIAPPPARETAAPGPREGATQVPREGAAHPAREDASRLARGDESRSDRGAGPRSAGTFEAPSSRAGADDVPNVHESAPDWWRAQVADLANAVQRIELGAQAVRLEAVDDEVAEQVDALDAEVARLVQFTRTLAYVAAPPARGDQVFDLAEMVQLFVKELASKSDAPRCLFRGPAYVWVRSDRVLLTQVFDALFWLAGACARGGELVRAQVKREGDFAEVRIEFPVGPLEGLDVERILEPYGVRRVLPDLGPNALSAARGILSGQGGRADLQRTSNGRLEWRVELPAVEAPPNGSTAPGGPKRAAASHPEVD